MQDDDIERVLKAAGPRERAPADIEDAVRTATRAEWRAVVTGRSQRRRARLSVALAAGVALAVVGAWFAASPPVTTAEPIATLAVARDDVQVRSRWWRGWEPGKVGRTLAMGTSVETGANARAGLVLAGNASVRLDHGTRIRFASADRLVIEAGTLYVDAGQFASPDARFVVETPAGVVRHVGTQYEVLVDGEAVRLRVREGDVEWRSQKGAVVNGRAGEQLRIAADGTVTRGPSAPYGESWEWIGSTTPAIDIEGRPLSEFLAWAGRELGRSVVFATPAAAAEAASIVVHGSISDLTPAQALDAVLATTSVRATLDDGHIIVSGGSAP